MTAEAAEQARQVGPGSAAPARVIHVLLRVARALVLPGAGVAAAAAVSWPFAAHLRGQTLGDIDALFTVWRLAWVADAIRAGGRGLFNAPIFHPEPRTLAYSDAILIPGLASAPLRWAGLEPVLVFNLITLGGVVASLVVLARLARHLTGDRAAAFFGGLVFALGPHRLEHLERLELIVSLFVPVAFLCHYRATTTGSAWWAAGIPLAVAAQFLTGMYHGLFLAVVAPLLVLDLWYHAANRSRVVRGVAFGSLVAALAIGAYAWPYLLSRDQIGERGLDETARYSATFPNLMAVHPRNWLLGGGLSRFGSGERHLFPGIAALVLGLVGLRVMPRRWLLLYGAAFLLALDMTFGVNGLLFPWIRDYASPFRGIRAPARAYVVALVPLALAAAFGFAAAMRAIRPRGLRAAAAAALILFTLAEYRTIPLLWQVDPPRQLEHLGIDRSALVLDLPIPRVERLDVAYDVHYMVDNIGTWARTLNGYSGNRPASYVSLAWIFRDFPSERALDEARYRGVTHLLLHQRWLGDAYFAQMAWMTRRADWSLVAEYDELGGRVGVFHRQP